MSGKRRKTSALHEGRVSSTTRRVLRDAVDARRATTVTASSTTDKPEKVAKKKGRRRRCMTCGHQFPADELHHEFDEDGRKVGWVCDGCF